MKHMRILDKDKVLESNICQTKAVTLEAMMITNLRLLARVEISEKWS
jgi:hypothetical protein